MTNAELNRRLKALQERMGLRDFKFKARFVGPEEMDANEIAEVKCEIHHRIGTIKVLRLKADADDLEPRNIDEDLAHELVHVWIDIAKTGYLGEEQACCALSRALTGKP